MAKRRQIIEIFAPTLGIKSNTPTTIMDPRAQPYGLNDKMLYGVNQKEYGTALYTTTLPTLSGPCIALYEAKYAAGTVLQAFSHTGVYKLASSTWSNDGQVFTGSADVAHWSGLMYSEKFVYNNGVDHMQVKASVSVTGTAMAACLSPTTHKAWALAALREHLCLYHTIEGGTEHPNRVRWSQKGAITATCMTGGTSGYLDIEDVEGEIQAAAPLGASNAIYSNESIHVQYWVGGTEIYRVQKTVSGIGTPSRRGVAVWKDVNYFLSSYNFHAYHGGDDLRDIGDPIQQAAFGEINNSALATAFVEVDPESEEVLFHVPTTGTNPDTVWVYAINNDSWSKLSRAYKSSGRYARADGLTIGELVGDIGAQTWKFGEYQAKPGAVVRLYGDVSGYVTRYDRTRFSVHSGGANVPQAFIYETPDLTGANQTDPASGDKVDFTSYVKRWTQFHVDLQGVGNANVFYSTDKGGNFTLMKGSPLVLTATGQSRTLDIDRASACIRFRITNTGTYEYAGVVYAAVEFIPQGEY